MNPGTRLVARATAETKLERAGAGGQAAPHAAQSERSWAGLKAVGTAETGRDRAIAKADNRTDP